MIDVIVCIVLVLCAANLAVLLTGAIRTKMYKPNIPTAKDDV